MKISLLRLISTLTEMGYTNVGIANLESVLNQIMMRGFYQTPKNVVIGATGIEPNFKLNERSIRVYLQTTDVRDCIILNHPSNSYVTTGNISADALQIGSRKYFQASHALRTTDNRIKQLGQFVVIV